MDMYGCKSLDGASVCILELVDCIAAIPPLTQLLIPPFMQSLRPRSPIASSNIFIWIYGRLGMPMLARKSQSTGKDSHSDRVLCFQSEGQQPWRGVNRLLFKCIAYYTNIHRSSLHDLIDVAGWGPSCREHLVAFA